MKLTVVLVLTIITLTGCVSIPANTNYKTSRINTNVKLLAFNDLSSKYVERPTFATTKSWDDNKNIHHSTIWYRADGYGSTYREYNKSFNKNVLAIGITSENAKDMINAIEKYIKWQQLALKNGDMFTKDIGKVKPMNSNSIISHYYKIQFYSGNKYSHYLVFNFCYPSLLVGEQCLSPAATLDKKSAINLKKEINLFLNGKIVAKNVSSKYN